MTSNQLHISYTAVMDTLPTCDIDDCGNDATYSLTIDTHRDIYNLWNSCASDINEALRQAEQAAEDDEIIIERMVTA